MTRITDETITNIRNKADIVDIVGRYVSLKKQGRNFVAVCPFHDDHNPSMSVSVDKQIYKCFVCGAGGNVFTFVQHFEKVSFPEAVQKVASMVGIQIEVNFTKVDKKYDEETLQHFLIMDESVRFLTYQLQAQDGVFAKEYLENRKISQEVAKYFELGYNKDNQLSNFLMKKGYSTETLITLNLIREYDQNYYDVFQNRIVFPIHDSLGKPVGFSGRAFNTENAVKYINTSDTVLYRKGNIIYNYHRAKEVARKEEEVFLVEGVIDVIALHLAGKTNVVASLGTALTKEQIRLLRMLSKKIVLCYDGDNAGKMASYKAGKLLSASRISFDFVKSLNEMDPDDYRMSLGNDALNQALAKRLTWVEFLMEYLLMQYDINNYSDRKKFALEVAAEINLLEDSFDKETYFNQLASVSGFSVEQLRGLEVKTGNQMKQENRTIQVVRQKFNNRLERAEYTIIAQLLSSKNACKDFQKELGFLFRQNLNKIVLLIIDYYRLHDTMNIADLITIIDDDSRKIVLDISESEMFSLEYDTIVLKEAMDVVKISLIDNKIQELRKRKSVDINSNNKLAEELIELKKEKEKLIRMKEE